MSGQVQVKESSATRAGRALVKARWAGSTAEERSAAASYAAKHTRVERRCFCGADSMWRACSRNFPCCRKAGVMVLNIRRGAKKRATPAENSAEA